MQVNETHEKQCGFANGWKLAIYAVCLAGLYIQINEIRCFGYLVAAYIGLPVKYESYK